MTDSPPAPMDRVTRVLDAVDALALCTIALTPADVRAQRALVATAARGGCSPAARDWLSAVVAMLDEVTDPVVPPAR